MWRAKHNVLVCFFGFITGCVPLLCLAFSSHLISSGCLSLPPSLLSSPSLSIICGVRSRSKRITAALCRTHYLTKVIFFLGNVCFRRCEVKAMVKYNLDETQKRQTITCVVVFQGGNKHICKTSGCRIISQDCSYITVVTV